MTGLDMARLKESTLFKIQRSITTSHEREQMLVYNNDRSIVFQSILTPDIARLMGTEPKIFAYGTLKDGIITIYEKVAKSGKDDFYDIEDF
jgi:hypothetical protein